MTPKKSNTRRRDPKKAFFLFDYNGTLLNDMPIWQDSMEEVFRRHKMKPPTVEQFYGTMTGTWMTPYNKYGVFGTPDELNAIYIPHYNSRIHEAELFPHTVETLDMLADAGAGLALISAQPGELVHQLLEKFDMEKFFKPGFLHVDTHDKTKVIEEILAKTGTDPDHCYYVGDAPSDTTQGQKAGVRTVGFLNGFVPQNMVFEKRPTYCIRSLKELAWLI